MRNRSHPLSWITLALCAAVAGCGAKPQAASQPAMPTPTVTVAVAKAQDVPVYLDEIGRNYAFEAVTVTPQVAGRIVERDFQDGAELAKGQLLFVIDPRPYQAQLDAAQAQLAQAKAALDLAETQLKMYDQLNDSRAVSQLDYQTKKNAVDVDKAQIQSAEAAVENAKLNLDYCYIHSPLNGRAGARLVDAGNVVQANTTALLSIQRVDPIYADFTVPEQDLSNVRAEMTRGTLKTLVRLPTDAESASRAGALTFLDNAVQSASGTVGLRATIPNSDRHFWPGQFVNVRLILSTVKNAILIPSQATQISQRGPYILVVKPDNTADMRLLTLGQRQGEDVVAYSGVEAGERVVVTGQALVIPGAKVRVLSPLPGAAGGGPGPATQSH